MIQIRADLIRADLDQGEKVLLICGFRSGSSADRSVLGLIRVRKSEPLLKPLTLVKGKGFEG